MLRLTGKTLVVLVTLGLLLGVLSAIFFDRKPDLPTRAPFILEIDLNLYHDGSFDNELPPVISRIGYRDYSERATWAALSRAATDDDVQAIAIRVHPRELQGMLTVALAQRLHSALEPIKAAGKPIWVYSHDLGLGMTALAPAVASLGDELWINPAGDVSVSGFALYTLYLRRFLEENGVEPYFYSRGSAKSGDDFFAEYQMPQAVRTNLQDLLDDSWNQVTQMLEENTQTPQSAWEQLARDVTILDLNQAKSLGLVSNIDSYEAFMQALKTKMDTDDLVNFATYVRKENYRLRKEERRAQDYDTLAARRVSEDAATEPASERPVLIAVVPIFGQIVEGGRALEGMTSSEGVIAQLQCAFDSADVGGVLLEINSPGGSGLASELIFQALERNFEREERKPVVAFMKDVAASGGYYVASGADVIFAQPGTITGSIGAFSGTLSIDNALRERNIAIESLHTAGGDLLGSMVQPPTPRGQQLLDAAIGRLYARFLNRVSAQRDITLEQLEPIASGRVYSGQTAKALGLVDALGTYRDVLAWYRQYYQLQETTPMILSASLQACPQDRDTEFERLLYRLADTHTVSHTLAQLYTSVPALAGLIEPLRMAPMLPEQGQSLRSLLHAPASYLDMRASVISRSLYRSQ